MTSFLAFLVVITIVVFFHELGHWAAARVAGVRVDALSIGFGRELLGFNRYGTRWKFSALPLGGYVKIHGLEEKSEDKDALCSKSALTNIWVFFAGPLANLIFAWLMFCALFVSVGSPSLGNKVGGVMENSAAAQVGIQAGDTILAINDERITHFEQAARIIAASDGRLHVRLLRGDKELLFKVVPQERGGRRLLGITAPSPTYQRLGVARAVVDAATFTYAQSSQVVIAIANIFSGESLDELGGPIQIAKFSGDFWRGGIVAFCFFLALISINLGLINLMPVPPLDGGRILLKVVEPLLGRRFMVLERASMVIGLFLVLMLLLVATWNDIVRILSA